jgi:GntR family transcriptional regulator, transcriptional repressor for pyruvate dehydrogenase complex
MSHINKTNIILKTTTCDQVVERIKQMIMDGVLKIGERLPTELQLAEMFGVSRVPVREALRTLRQAGFLETKHGVGTFVSVVTPDILGNEFGKFMFFQEQSIIEVLQLRRLVEVEAVRLTATLATEKEIERILQFERIARGEIVKLRNNQDNAFYSADLKFHVAIAEASHNEVFGKLINSIHETLHIHQFLSLKETPQQDEVINYHKDICEAIADRNPERAAAMMEKHITRIEELMSIALKKKG